MAGGRKRWTLNVLGFSLAIAAASIPFAWIVSLLRVSPTRYYSGAGVFAGLVGGTLMVAMTSATFGNWMRKERWRQSAAEAFAELDEAA